MPSAPPSPEPALRSDPHRLAAARRLAAEVVGPDAFDRLCALAVRLLGTARAEVVLCTDPDTVVGSWGLPPGAVGRLSPSGPLA